METKVTARQVRFLYQETVGKGRMRSLHLEAVRGVAAMKILPRLLHNVLNARKEDGNARLKDEIDIVGMDHFEDELDSKIVELEWWLDSVIPMVGAAEDWLDESNAPNGESKKGKKR